MIVSSPMREINILCRISSQVAMPNCKSKITDSKFSSVQKSSVNMKQSGSGRTCRIKEHFSGLLSEVLKENCSRMQKQGDILRFPDLAVNTRPLSVYDELIGGLENE